MGEIQGRKKEETGDVYGHIRRGFPTTENEVNYPLSPPHKPEETLFPIHIIPDSARITQLLLQHNRQYLLLMRNEHRPHWGLRLTGYEVKFLDRHQL